MFGWNAVAAFFAGKKGPYGVALAAFVLVGYLAYIDIPTINLGIVTAFAGSVAITYFLRNREQGQGATYYLKMRINGIDHINPLEDQMKIGQITADQKIVIEGFEGVDRTGGPGFLENPVATATVEGDVTIITNDAGETEVTPSKQGTLQFRVDGDPIPGEEAGNVFTLCEFDVTPGKTIAVRPKFRVEPIEPTPEG